MYLEKKNLKNQKKLKVLLIGDVNNIFVRDFTNVLKKKVFK